MDTRKPRPARGAMMLLSLGLASALLVCVADVLAADGPTFLRRITTAIGTGWRVSWAPSLDASGRLIAFESDSDLLGQGIPDDQWEIWLYDTRTNATNRVTWASPNGRDSMVPDLSADGTRTAFQSDSDFLGQGIPLGQWEIWLYDTTTMTVTRITTASHANRDSQSPSLSADGTVVAFYSDSDILSEGIADERYEVWLYDTTTMNYTRVTTASHANRDSREPSLSGDGTRVAFYSDSDFLGQSIPQGQAEIWLYDTTTMTVTRISPARGIGDRDSFYPDLSTDGTVVAFQSDSDLLDEGVDDEQIQVWLYDTSTMTVTRVTTNSHGNRQSFGPSLNADGTMVAFFSDSDLLSEGIPDEQYEVWRYDTTAATVTRVTSASPGGRDSRWPSLSADGRMVAFQSDSDFLAQLIPLGREEIWLHGQMRLYLPLAFRQSP